MEQSNLFCELCRIKFTDAKSQAAHLLGKKHQLALHNAYIIHKKTRCGIFVSGLPNLIPKDKVMKFFEEFGPVKSIHIGEGNKFAILEFKDEAIAQNLIKTKHLVMLGKTMHIKARVMKEQAEKIESEKCEEDLEAINDSLKIQTDFGTQIQILLSKLQPNQALQMQKYKQLCNDLETVLQEIFLNCKVYPFGSTITGLNFKNSDVDVYVEYKPVPNNDAPTQETTPAQLVKKARNALPKSRMFYNVIAIPKAKTPIVKCLHVLTNISCDFNFKSMLGVCNSYLIKYYLDLDKNLKSVILILKHWCRMHELSRNNGRFTNYALTMLLIFYLQQEPYLIPTVCQMQDDKNFKNMQEGWNGGFKPVLNLSNILQGKTVQEVLHGFFNFYLNFNYNLNVICPYLGKIVPKTDFLKVDTLPDTFLFYKINITRVQPLQIEIPICVQDPFEHNHNVTKAVSTKILEEFVSLCKVSVNILRNTSIKNNILYKLFTDEPEDEKFKCSENSCEFKLSMGNILTYLEQQVTSDVQHKSSEIRRLWYDTVNHFFIAVLIKVFKFEVQVIKNDTKSKSLKIEGQSDVHESEFLDSVTFYCKGKHNLWAARKAITRDLDLSNIEGILNKQKYITEYICEVLCENIVLSEPVIELNITMNARETPIQMEFVLTKVSARKGCFKSFGIFCGSKLPHWFNVHEKELTEGIKKIVKEEKQ